MNETATLPIWVLLLFCIALVACITLVYTRGNWRTSLLFTGLATFVVLSISGIDAWSAYLKTHFVGQFDQLGIPFREAGPGWTLLPASWPLWLVPTFIFAIIAAGLGWWLCLRLNNAVPKNTSTETLTIPVEIIPPAAVAPPMAEQLPTAPAFVSSMQKNLASRLELESLKHDLATTKDKLATAIEIAEEQVDKNQDLEIQLAQLEEEHEEATTDLQDKITALELEISAKEAQNDELTSLALQQAEELAKLKEELENR